MGVLRRGSNHLVYELWDEVEDDPLVRALQLRVLRAALHKRKSAGASSTAHPSSSAAG